MGEGDETIVVLLRAISEGNSFDDVKGIYFKRNGQVVGTPPRPMIGDISAIPFIDFDIFDVNRYIDKSKRGINDPVPIARDKLRALPVNTARGCVAKCGFCYHVLKTYPYRYRSAESIINEINELIGKYSINYVFFWDELTLFSKKQTKMLVEKILEAKLDIYWTAQCRASLFNKKEDISILQMMRDAGCVGLQYSLESADSNILKSMKKNITVGQFSKQTKLIQDAGIPAWTSLVVGYPQETPETLKRTFDVCIENNIYPSVGYLLPQPGSDMYQYAIDHGYITDEEEFLLTMGDRQDLTLNMTKMEDAKLEDLVYQGLERCNEKLSIGLPQEKLLKTQYFKAAEREFGKG